MSPDPSRHVPLRQPTAFHVPVCLPPLPAANRKTCLVARPAMSLHDLARASPGPGRLTPRAQQLLSYGPGRHSSLRWLRGCSTRDVLRISPPAFAWGGGGWGGWWPDQAPYSGTCWKVLATFLGPRFEKYYTVREMPLSFKQFNEISICYLYYICSS